MSLNDAENEKEEEKTLPQTGAFFPLPFHIQLQNTFPVEISVKRFPIVVTEAQGSLSPNINLKLNQIQIDENNSQAQIILNVEVIFPNEPRLFEIHFSILGLFTYAPTCPSEKVTFYLERGSISILLPFARELLASLCMRINMPVFLIPMVSIAPLPPEEQ